MAEKLSSIKLDHVGIVVKDIEMATKYLSPFCLEPFKTFTGPPIKDVRVYGKPCDIQLKMAIADLGPIHVEILQPMSAGSPHWEFLDKKGEGIHHLAYHVENLESEVAKLTKLGYKVIMSLKWADSDGGLAFLETGEDGGFIFELLQI